MDFVVKHGLNKIYIETKFGEAVLLYDIEEKKKIMRIYHTFVPDGERGRGLAEKLAFEGFNIAKTKGLFVKPDCDYIKHFVENHNEFLNIIVN